MEIRMSTANKITIFRIILVPVFMCLLLIDSTACKMWALAVFILASVSDWADGYIARHCNQVTNFGKFMDPIADKLLTMAAYLALLETGRITWVGSAAIMLIFLREMMVSGLRTIAGTNGNVIAASMFGKIKTVAQMVTIIAAIVMTNDKWFIQEPAILVTNIIVWISVVFTLLSGIDYLWKNKEVFKG